MPIIVQPDATKGFKPDRPGNPFPPPKPDFLVQQPPAGESDDQPKREAQPPSP